MLAGVSVDYYTRMERGNLAGVSDSVLAGLARALQLDEAERGHLYDLARAANAAPQGWSPARSIGSGRAFSRPWTRWRACPRTCGTAAATCSRRTGSATPSTPRSTPTRPGRPTWHGSSS